jgi:two-component system cell cycle response regulator
MIEKLKLEIAHGKQPLTVCICDIDKFKIINDQYGYITSDEVLRKFAIILKEELAPEAAIGRISGDEFCVLFRVHRDEAKLAMEQVRKKLAHLQFRATEDCSFAVTASFGLSELGKGMSWKGLMNLADKSLFEAKRKGRNRIA